VSPRPYNLGQRRGPVDRGRQQILAAARRLLAGTASYTAFTVDAVAKEADVARATVYYQFGSKAGLLEAICDSLAEAGQMRELATAFTEADPREALRRFTGCFGTFWAVDRAAMRRLRALAALDPDVGAVISARDERRREGLTVLVDRLAEATALAAEPGHAVRVLFALTSFETFDALAGPGQDLTAVVPDVNKLAEAALQLT
jgi:AcrR family transcriptional regulator